MTDPLAMYERQTRLFGKEGQRKIMESNVAIVGAGGLGCHVIQQLAHLGVGKISIIDLDKVEETDLNRLVGSHSDDFKRGLSKVAVAERLIHEINQSIEVQAVAETLLSETAFLAIKKADFVFGCLDNEGARLVLNELCLAFEVPYLDLASDIIEGKYGGRVFFSFDEKGCLYCYGLIDTDEAQRDLMGEEAAKDQQQIYGVDRDKLDRSGPAVVSINGVVASLAVTEFMAFIVKLRQPIRLAVYHAEQGVVNRNVDPPREDCYYCKSVRGLKDKADVDRYWKSA